MKTHSALRALVVTGARLGAAFGLLVVRRRPEVGSQARRRKGREGGAGASRARAHASFRDRRHHRHRRRRAEDQRHQGRHAHRHRASLQRRLRRNRARQSGRRSLAAGRESRDRHSLAVHPAQRAAPGHRHQCRGDATLLLPEGEEGRDSRSCTPIPSASARSAGRLPKARRPSFAARRIRSGGRRRRSSPSTRRTTIRCRPSCPRARTIRSAASRSISAGPRT